MSSLRNLFDSHEEGFTIVELLVSIALISIIVLAAGRVILYFMENNKRAQQQNKVMEELNSTIYTISYDIRNARKAIGSENPVEIEDNGRTLIVYQNTNNDNRMEKIYYQLQDNGNLTRVVINSNNTSYPFTFDDLDDQSKHVILTGVEDTEIFIDDTTEGSNPRKIKIDISVNQEYIQESSSMTITSRSRGIGGN
mgnify:CR=1 FL=1